MIDKRRIIDEIKRLAIANGKTPGRKVFERETGIKMSDWYPHIWLAWGNALEEAGFAPNRFQSRMANEAVIQDYIDLIRELGKIPVGGEIRRKTKRDKSFPSYNVFRRFGGKEKLIEEVVTYCQRKSGFEDVLKLCAGHTQATVQGAEPGRKTKRKIATEFVYLMKSGRHYKIGRTNSVGRRSSELSVKIPVPPRTIHSIETDDPIGVEKYWHNRFGGKRGEGEWFELSTQDVEAFKRWKRIV